MEEGAAHGEEQCGKDIDAFHHLCKLHRLLPDLSFLFPAVWRKLMLYVLCTIVGIFKQEKQQDLDTLR